MRFAGHLALQSTSVLTIELASLLDFDQLTINGTLTYGGTLVVNLLGGFVPSIGAQFDLFDLANFAIGSSFTSIVVNHPGGTGFMNYATGVLTVIPEPVGCTLLILGASALLTPRRRRATS